MAVARRALEAFRLVPTTLKGRARLKQLFYGAMPTVPAELVPGFAEIAPREQIVRGREPAFKVLYVAGLRCAS